MLAQLRRGIDEERSVISEKFARLLDEQPGTNDRVKRQKRADGG